MIIANLATETHLIAAARTLRDYPTPVLNGLDAELLRRTPTTDQQVQRDLDTLAECLRRERLRRLAFGIEA
jgi:hypothetical protein